MFCRKCNINLVDSYYFLERIVMTTVKVYSFKIFNENGFEISTPPIKRTKKYLEGKGEDGKSRFEIIDDSEEEVDEALIDSDGVFDPRLS